MPLVKDSFTLHKRFRIACHDIITITRRFVFCVLLENVSVLTEKEINHDNMSLYCRPRTPHFNLLKGGLQGYALFSYFYYKIWIVGSR